MTGFWIVVGSAGPAIAVQTPETLSVNATEAAATASLDACQRYATQFYQQADAENFGSLRLLEEDLDEAKYEDKVGTQFVSTVLSGSGVWLDKTGAPSDVRFTCLLESSARAIFVEIAEDGRRDPVASCWDAFEPAGWGQMSQCLQDALKREEAALAKLLLEAAKQAGQSMDKLSARKTLQKSTDFWVSYRDAECDRRQALSAGRNHPDIGEFTCRIHATAQRISDLQSDD
ncbi:MAG: lysozyme inhibitor LprI family protein [Thermoanaerobaculia bacterium]